MQLVLAKFVFVCWINFSIISFIIAGNISPVHTFYAFHMELDKFPDESACGLESNARTLVCSIIVSCDE